MEESEHIEKEVDEKTNLIEAKEVVEKSSLENDPSVVIDEVLHNEEINATDEGSGHSEEEGSESRDISEGDSGTEMSGDEENIEDDEDLIEEREEGDGQESAPTKKVDDDEDKRNPQYIPKKGTFYEHDDRTAVEEEAEEGAETEDAEKKEKGPGGDAEETKAGKKKVWNEDGSRWTHDKFNDAEQAPKSRSELIAIYGYDIRNEDGPPRPRRRRRYGRGPNKYTRNWEDEAAYNKAGVLKKPRAPRKSRSEREEFPPLQRDENEEEHRQSPPNRDRGVWDRNRDNRERDRENDKDNRQKTMDFKSKPSQYVQVPPQVQVVQQSQVQQRNIQHSNGNMVDRNERKDFNQGPRQITNNSQRAITNRRETFYQDNNPTSTRVVKASRYSTSNIDDNRDRDRDRDMSYRGRGSGSGSGITKTRNFRGTGRTNVDMNRSFNKKSQQESDPQEYIMSQNFINKNISSGAPSNTQIISQGHVMDEIERGVSNMNISRDMQQSNRSGHNRGVSNVPPRLQSQENQRQAAAPKRYSSLRQKSLPEMGGPQQTAPPSANAPTFTPHHAPPPPTIIHYTPHTEYTQAGAVVSNSNQALIQPGFAVAQYAQAPFAGTYIPPQGLTGPAVPLPQQQAPPPGPPPPQILNYQPPQGPPPQVAPPPQPQYTPNVTEFAAFPHQQFAPVNQTQGGEVYHPHPAQTQGGITYYSMEQQQVMQMQRIQKRPKAAIPIVPPPEHKEPRGRGRLNQNDDPSQVGNSPSNNETTNNQSNSNNANANTQNAYEGEREGVLDF